ncbi:hypothetical protein ACWX0K_25040 (plasmid) [Nitrobacteraceae bacterium UC4446_H13]
MNRLPIDPRAAVDAVRTQLLRAAEGGSHAPQKSGGVSPTSGSRAYAMLAWDRTSGRFAAKLTYNRFPNVAVRKAHYYTLLALFDDQSGAPIALLDCESVGAARTAAVSVCFGQLCCPRPPRRVAIVGTGVQATTHCRYFAALFPDLESIEFNGNRHDELEAVLREFEGSQIKVAIAPNLEESIRQADITIAATHQTSPSSVHPLWLRAGSLHIKVGWGYHAEVAALATYRGGITSDTRLANSEASPAANVDGWAMDFNLLDAVAGRAAGFKKSQDIVFALNSGLAITDLAVADLLIEHAMERKIGERIPFWES